jgi:hypothetical protein
MKRCEWRPAHFRSAKTMHIADHGGRRLSVRLVRGGLYRASVNGRAIGCWSGMDAARAAAEAAAALERPARVPGKP